jgi:hypothetical protein
MRVEPNLMMQPMTSGRVELKERLVVSGVYEKKSAKHRRLMSARDKMKLQR